MEIHWKNARTGVKSILSILLAIMMIIGMMPGMAFADDSAPEQVTATIYGHTNFFSDIDLFESNSAGEKIGTTDIMYNIEPDSGTYTVSLVPGYYLVEGRKTDDDVTKSYGTILVNITADDKDISLCAVKGIKPSNSGWVYGTDYTTTVTVENKDRVQRIITISDEFGADGLACLALEGDTVSATFTPTANRPGYLPNTKRVTLNANTSSVTIACQQTVNVTITAPAGSTIDMGSMATYYVYTFYDAVETTNGESTVSTFSIPVNSDVFYRVQNPSGVTYWDYTKFATNSSITVSAEALHIGDSEFTKSTVDRSFANKYDLANIYLNGNSAGYINLNAGGSYELNVFRNWMAIESISNAKVALPDMHYRVVDFNGNDSSDVITVTPSEHNSSVANIRAVGQGTAVVLVTYDAMTHNIAMGASGDPNCKKFSAIWPEFTGVLVVSVGQNGTLPATNMTMERPGAANPTSIIDAEHDIFFYTGDEGASYSFTPESGATVSVARPVVSSNLNYNGFETSGITTDGEGKVTITGLKTGRNIVKVEKDGKANYQVITAYKTSYTMTDASGNPITAENKPKAGDKVKVQFNGLVNPAEKLSGVYNFNASVFYTGEEGSTFKSNPGGTLGIYDFSSTPSKQLVEITIPKYFPGDEYNLTGCIKMAGYGSPIGAHRGITYATGSNPNFTAPNVGMVLSLMPEIKIALAPTTFLAGKLNFVDNNGDTVSREALTLAIKDADGNAVQVADDGTFKGVAKTFSYEIAGSGYARKTGSFEMTEAGANEFTIELTKLVEGAWNGSEKTEPAKVGDVYQVTNGAELAWVTDQSTKQDLKAKLVNDIELGGYPWVGTASSSNKTFIFDGNGKTVSGLNATRGLFGAIGKNSHVHDVTVKGESSGFGGIVGYIYAAGAKVENCVSCVNIKSTGNNVGGVIGYATSDTFVKRCVNYGSVEGKQDVGGIIGGFAGNCTVEECVNYGNVKCTQANAGGVFGGTGYPVVIKNCYNAGEVSGTGAVGGIGGKVDGGRNKKAKVINCYSSGTVTGDSSFGAFGSVVATTAVLTNNVYLETAGNADSNAEALSDAALRSLEFGDVFKLACGRYPALTWETGVASHTQSGTPTVVNPGCNTRGYTEAVCSVCGLTYREYSEPLGHQRGADAVDDGVKCTFTCARCHEHIVEWADSRFEFINLRAPEITNMSFTDGAEFKWDWNSATSRLESTNVEEDKKTAESTFNFTVATEGLIYFDYGVSSESGCDKMYAVLKKNGAEFEKVADGISGEVVTSYSALLAPGNYSLELKYTKDSGTSAGSDVGFIGNFKFHTPSGTPNVVAPTCVAGGYTEHVCGICGETYRDTYTAALGHQRGTDAVDDGLKWSYTCARCGEAVVDWHDARFELLSFKAPEITNISFTDAADYKWVLNKAASRIESNNVGKDNKTAESTLSFTIVNEGTLSFDYGVSSEQSYDKMTVTIKKGDAELAKPVNAISGTVTSSYAITLSPGAYSITLKYSKDGSSASGSDLGYIANLAFATVTGGNTGGGSDPGTSEEDTIRVSMRLIGSELATQDVDLGANNYIPSYVTWIATTSYDMPKDSTVYDLWIKALQDAGLRSEGADNNYVTTVYAPSGYELSEMTNGPRSGWMYTINGKHPRLGLKEQPLAKKNAVVWHYVNDYAYEVDDWTDDPKYPALGDGTYYNGWLRAADKIGATGGSPASTSNAKKAEEVKAEETPAPTVTTNVETQATVTDGKATASVKAADVTKAIAQVAEQAKAQEQEQAKVENPAQKPIEKEVVLEIKTDGNATAVEAKLPTEAVKELAKAEAKTVLQTECGNIEIPSESMSSIADQAAGKDISVTVETKKATEVVENIGAEKLQQETGLDEKTVNEAIVVEVKINVGETTITSFGGKSIKLSLPVAEKQEIGKTYKVIAISEDGSIEVMTGVCVIKDGKKFVDVSSSHLTTFVVTNEEVKNPFSDVHDSDYFYAPVLWAIEKNITAGTTADTFAPFESCTRAQMVTFLWRAAGKPWASANLHFSDVASDAYYAEAVEWAVAAGITKGIGETTFAPNDVVTREQLASFIYRYAVEMKKGYAEAPTTKLDYYDASSVHAWADEAMHWCVEKGIVTGMGDKMLAPQNQANRAQIVTMLYRFSSVL